MREADVACRCASTCDRGGSAIDILLQKGLRAKDYLGEIKALFEWMQQNVRYTNDTFRVEVPHSARRT
jgi:hypothetical protein